VTECRFSVGDYVQCFMQDGATYGFGYVISIDKKYVTVRLETLFPNAKVKYARDDSKLRPWSNG